MEGSLAAMMISMIQHGCLRQRAPRESKLIRASGLATVRIPAAEWAVGTVIGRTPRTRGRSLVAMELALEGYFSRVRVLLAICAHPYPLAAIAEDGIGSKSTGGGVDVIVNSRSDCADGHNVP